MLLQQIGGGETPAPPMASFLLYPPAAKGPAYPTTANWQAYSADWPVRQSLGWNMELDCVATQRSRPLPAPLSRPETVPVSAGEWKQFTSTPELDLAPVDEPAEPEPWETSIVPPPGQCFMAAAAEPVEAWLDLRNTLSPIEVLRTPVMRGEWMRPIAGAARTAPESWIASPGPAPMAGCTAPVAALAPLLRLHAPAMPAAWLEAVVTVKHAAPESWVAESAPEPVECIPKPVTAASFLEAMRIRLPEVLPGVLPVSLAAAPAEVMAVAHELVPVTASAPLSMWAGVSVAPAAAALLLPGLALTPELDSLQMPEAPLEPLGLWAPGVPSPMPEPAERFVPWSTAGAMSVAPAVFTPGFAAAISETYLPFSGNWRASLKPEPAMAPVRLRFTETPMEMPSPAAALSLPKMEAVVTGHETPACTVHAAGPEPEAVESILAATAAEPFAPAAFAPFIPRMAALAASAPALACAAASLQADAVETLLQASVAASAHGQATARVLPVQLALAGEAGALGAAGPRNAAMAAQTMPTAWTVPELTPMPTVRLIAPAHRHECDLAAMPRAELRPLEYFSQRVRSEPVGRPEWKFVRFAPLAPHFNLQPILDRLEDLVRQQTPGTFFTIHRPHRSSRSVLTAHALRIAASVLIVAGIWAGAGAVRSSRPITVPTEVRDATAALSAGDRSLPAAPAGKSGGPLNWLRRGIANRASLQVGEDFSEGMGNWGANAAKGYAAGWSHSPQGYVQTGALALFRPTLKFDDYRMEFFGQIESKSVAWAVRATDAKNYHAMKFTVLEAGLRPVIAMVHYNVIDGHAGRRVQTPLNVMVHNNRPFQVAVTVRGNHFITSVDGEEVDSFTDGALSSGGVGFFSEAGERARVYWMRVTKNDDWLGHVCALLSGDSTATASLRPGNSPSMPWRVPGTGEDNVIIAAAGFGLPYSRKSQIRRNR